MGEPLQIRVRSIPRQRLRADESVVEHLRGLVLDALEQGRPPSAAMWVQRARTIDLVGLPNPSSGTPLPLSSLLAGLSTTRTEQGGHAEAVGILGCFGLRRPGQKAPISVAMVFGEWEDCRWWHWQTMLDAHRKPVESSASIRSAEDGDALPDRLGRWWTLARRRQMQVMLHRVEASASTTSDVVH